MPSRRRSARKSCSGGWNGRRPADIITGSVGGIAQLGERLHGMQEVSGSIPLTSTNPDVIHRRTQSPSSRGLGHRPFTAITGVRIPVGTPNTKKTPVHAPAFFFLPVISEDISP